MANPLPQSRILVVDDEERIRSIVAVILRDNGYLVETAENGSEAIEISAEFKPDVLLVDLQMPRIDGVETCLRIRERLPNTVAVILTAHGTIQSAVQAIRQGIYDYIPKPFDNDQLLLVVKRAMEVHRLASENERLQSALIGKHEIVNVLGEAEIVQQVRRELKRIAQADATVLIRGESGTGKELAARAIHYESARKTNPLVIIDCGAIPSTLIENEFFGHERGAFTDARDLRIGKFEEADGGTAFLDEIGELPLEAQTKLLRILQEKEFTRVGGTQPIKVDVRIIAATNKDLEHQVSAGLFREDLYYRLNVLTLKMPSLRDHREDIPLYARHFLAKHRDAFGKRVDAIADEAMTLLKRYEWKGNIRELENVVQRALLGAEGTMIESRHLSFLNGNSAPFVPQFNDAEGLEPFVRSLSEQAERRVIVETLEKAGWNRSRAAEILKISRKTLFNKMQQYGIAHEDDTAE